MAKEINGLDKEVMAVMSNSEVPTIKFSEVCTLVQKMEDTLDIIANEEQYDGFNAALDMVKEFFVGDWHVDTETGEIVTTLMGKETSRMSEIKFKNGSYIKFPEADGVKPNAEIVETELFYPWEVD